MNIKKKSSCTTKGPSFINLDTEHVNKKLKLMSPGVDKSNSQDASNASTAAASTTTSNVASQISITKSEDSWAMVEQNMISEAKSEDSWMLVD